MEKSGSMQKLDVSRQKIPWWRRTYLVNREFQNRYARTAVLIGIFNSILSVGLLLWAFWAFNIWQGQRLPLPVRLIILFVFLLNWVGIYVAGVLSTQKISGPLFNLLRQFQKVGKADFSARAKFREGDEIHYVARSFNEMAQQLEVRQTHLNEILMRCETQLAEKNLLSLEGHLKDLRQILNPPKDPMSVDAPLSQPE